MSPTQSLAAFDTLYTVLETTTRVVAPLLPLTAEEVWRGLTGGRSVHLTDWPSVGRLTERRRVWSAAMDRVREVCSTALGAAQGRGAAGPAAAAVADGGRRRRGGAGAVRRS